MLEIIFLALTYPIFSLDASVNTPIVDRCDIEFVLDETDHFDFTEEIAKLDNEVHFWREKLKTNNGGYIFYQKIAVLKEKLFEHTGDVDHLVEADRYYELAVSSSGGRTKANILLARSANAIKLHHFENAYELTQEAFTHTWDNISPSFMAFDAAMELGKFDEAGNIMEQYANPESYDFLVRYAKYLDHKGDLTSAIIHMEQALKVSKSESDTRYLWALSNLGDMYSHDGRVQKSYDTYLKALELDPHNLHVLKGLSWIAYAQDNNTTLAKEILEIVASANNLPDAYLLLTEIETYQKNMECADVYKEKFLRVAEKPILNQLYASYLIDFYIEEGDFAKAKEIALLEVNLRPVAGSYAQLAQVCLGMGERQKAVDIMQNEVIGKTYEPDPLYKAAIVLFDSQRYNEAKILLLELLEAGYELGPLALIHIQNRLESLSL